MAIGFGSLVAQKVLTWNTKSTLLSSTIRCCCHLVRHLNCPIPKTKRRTQFLGGSVRLIHTDILNIRVIMLFRKNGKQGEGQHWSIVYLR